MLGYPSARPIGAGWAGPQRCPPSCRPTAYRPKVLDQVPLGRGTHSPAATHPRYEVPRPRLPVDAGFSWLCSAVLLHLQKSRLPSQRRAHDPTNCGMSKGPKRRSANPEIPTSITAASSSASFFFASYHDHNLRSGALGRCVKPSNKHYCQLSSLRPCSVILLFSPFHSFKPSWSPLLHVVEPSSPSRSKPR